MAFLFLLILLVVQPASSAIQAGFIFNGFQGANLTIDGSTRITSNGLLQLSNDSHIQTAGHAFYPLPFPFKNNSHPSSNGTVVSFSTRFVFAISSEIPGLAGHGLAFTLSPNPGVPGSLGLYFLGLLNESNLGDPSNHIFAVEFDTSKDPTFKDIDGNHVGIDINNLISNDSATAAYFTKDDQNKSIDLQSGSPILAWIDYESNRRLLNVSIAPAADPIKPTKPLLSFNVDLSPILNDLMYVGFSCGVGKQSSDQYMLGWSFAINGEAEAIDLSRLPSLPKRASTGRPTVPLVNAVAGTIGAFIAVIVLFISGYVFYRRRKLSDVMEDWEKEYPHRFSYRTLYRATKGFSRKELLGSGGFGTVFKGILPGASTPVAVKRVTHNGKQGLREFVAEISSLGRLRHRNLVQLQGWCRRQEELLLVYDFMPNGSLDNILFDDQKARHLLWEQRFNILKGIASVLLYLHEGWEQVVVHRDVKASNVLLDAEMNGRLGDFGLARLHEHNKNPQTTRLVGTFGYMAPELSRTNKATRKVDVFAFGALLLEVACGKRPIHLCTWSREEEEEEAAAVVVAEDAAPARQGTEEDIVLAEWVLKWWKRGQITRAVDHRLEGRYEPDEAELVLKLGLLCSQATPEARPTMRRVVQCLEAEASVHQGLVLDGLMLQEDYGFDQLVLSTCASMSFRSSSTSSY
ncbi:L-type lectin-domain containing receptor kinase S.4-like [Nymphaea colorata]|uniref:non-specific serine/threonine protein kinase n=1 Tax=Nymphaea colorata TaxID=210225 RepID=A0A5K1EG89_9MAGN|nr:L-type lectin-domain containing receptor kinase S.4-like [Nymphaea colorata]